MSKKRAQIHVTLDPELYSQVRARLVEKDRDRIEYGKMSTLISELLTSWLKKNPA